MREYQDRPSRTERLVAGLLSAMVVATVAGLVTEVGTMVAGGLAWSAAALLLPRLTPRQRLVVAVLCGVGLAGVGWGALNGHPPEWRLMLYANQSLIGMLAAISFLRLVAPKSAPTAAGRSGRAGVWQTMLGVHLFGAVINISALDIVGDRFSARGPMDRGHLLLLSRGYSAGAFWSPFWGATAAALAYAPDARVPVLMAVGGCFALVGLGISGFTVTKALGPGLREFRGYPLTLRALVIPVTLVVVVLGVHFARPDLPIVAVITVCAPALTLICLAVTTPRALPRRVRDHAVVQLPGMAGELVLFLSAGLLIAGFTPLTDLAGSWVPISGFTVWEAWALVAVMAALSACGLHPVISIAIAANLLAAVQPDPTLFAMAGLIAWGLQASGGPLSGLNIVMQGRYGVDSFTLARWNLPYVAVLLVLAGPALLLCQALIG